MVGEANKRPVYAKDAAGNDTDVVVDHKRKVVQRRADATDAMQKAISEFALRLAVALHRETRGATMAATAETVRAAEERAYAMKGRRRDLSHPWEAHGITFSDENPTEIASVEAPAPPAPRKRKTKEPKEPSAAADEVKEPKVKKARKVRTTKKEETVVELPPTDEGSESSATATPTAEPPARSKWTARMELVA